MCNKNKFMPVYGYTSNAFRFFNKAIDDLKEKLIINLWMDALFLLNEEEHEAKQYYGVRKRESQ